MILNSLVRYEMNAGSVNCLIYHLCNLMRYIPRLCENFFKLKFLVKISFMPDKEYEVFH